VFVKNLLAPKLQSKYSTWFMPQAAPFRNVSQTLAARNTPDPVKKGKGPLKKLHDTWRILFGVRRVPASGAGHWEEGAIDATDLVVLLHAYGTSPGSLNQVANNVREKFPRADLFRPVLPFHVFSTAHFNVIAKEVVEAITQRHGARPYSRIILVGHSMGALLARKVYVVACGQTPEAPLEEEFSGMTPAPWADKVQRIVLLAAMNRGWRISHHLSITKALGLSFGVLVGRIVEFVSRRPLMVMQIRRGAPALTQLRLQWLAMRQAAKVRKCGAALTVQLLGSIDDLVSPDDNVDLVSGRDFVYLDVPRSGHLSLIYLKGDPKRGQDQEEATRAAGRARVFSDALSGSKDYLELKSAQLADAALAQDETVTHVIFVVHGIRDAGYWTEKIARHVKALGEINPQSKFAMVTSSYGYFPMAPFLAAAQRRKKVEWLMDQYAQALSRYPKARRKFSCVAHSNGTYLVAKALEEYPAVQFERIVFAGSVVRRAFPWHKFTDRVQAVMNYVATADWVVAFFPKLFEQLRIQDLGSAGHDGFAPVTSGVMQVRYVHGGHSAALGEEHWNDIARFVVYGTPVKATGKQDPVVKALGIVPPVVWALIIGILGTVAWCILSFIPDPEFKTVIFIAYLWLIWKLLNWL
jgi:pimeloyl-ACP methyl ester carboxylesterase